MIIIFYLSKIDEHLLAAEGSRGRPHGLGSWVEPLAS